MLLGHAKLDTTALYTRVANTTIRSVTGPLDRLTNAGCQANIARAKELIAAPVPVMDPPAEPDDAARSPLPPPIIARHAPGVAAA